VIYISIYNADYTFIYEAGGIGNAFWLRHKTAPRGNSGMGSGRLKPDVRWYIGYGRVALFKCIRQGDKGKILVPERNIKLRVAIPLRRRPIRLLQLHA